MSVSNANVDAAEIERFERLAARWWDPDGESRALHDLNPQRLAFVAERVMLPQSRVADIGCGGGLLSEALAAAGARVVAVDLAPALLDVARLHLLETGLQVEYRLASCAELAAKEAGSFDAVCCMELLEHVPDPPALVGDLARLLKPGGRVFISTLDRTPQAFAAAILGAEYLMRLLPRGTHHYAQFIRPAELGRWLRGAGLELEEVAGIAYNPMTRKAKIVNSPQVNYIVAARKRA